MKHFVSALAIYIGCLSFAGGTSADEERGFEPLFDGKTLMGWHGYQQDDVPPSWIIEDGSIRGSGAGPDLLTDTVHGDFDLRFEWKISEAGNSGVIYRATEDEQRAHQTGPEYQLLDDSQSANQDSPTTSTGALYGLYGASDKTLQPAGEFNRSRIVVQGERIEHWLNGEKLVDCEIGSEDWNKKVAASKFHKWDRFAKNKQGHVALQAHGSPVWFRGLRIKQLAPKVDRE